MRLEKRRLVGINGMPDEWQLIDLNTNTVVATVTGEANADLLLAAPQMGDMLAACARQFEADAADFHLTNHGRALVDMARAARSIAAPQPA